VYLYGFFLESNTPRSFRSIPNVGVKSKLIKTSLRRRKTWVSVLVRNLFRTSCVQGRVREVHPQWPTNHCSRVAQCFSSTVAFVHVAHDVRFVRLVHSWFKRAAYEVWTKWLSAMAFKCVANEGEAKRFVCYLIHTSCRRMRLLVRTSTYFVVLVAII
jgi:hypothetical protein